MDTEHSVEYMRLTGRWWEFDTRAEVAQAVGMVSVQLDCPLQDAATMLRGHTAAHGHEPADIALDILRRQLIFAP